MVCRDSGRVFSFRNAFSAVMRRVPCGRLASGMGIWANDASSGWFVGIAGRVFHSGMVFPQSCGESPAGDSPQVWDSCDGRLVWGLWLVFVTVL